MEGLRYHQRPRSPSVRCLFHPVVLRALRCMLHVRMLPMGSSTGGRVMGLLTALMSALAAGAVWCVVAMALGRELAILALPIAAIIAWALRSHDYPASRLGAVIAAVGTALACFYAQYLLATAEIASIFALPFRESLAKAGFAMTTDLMLKRLSLIDFTIFGAAMMFAALLVLRRR